MDVLLDPRGAKGARVQQRPAPAAVGTRDALLPWRPRPPRTPDASNGDVPPRQTYVLDRPDATVLRVHEIEDGVLLVTARPDATDATSLARSLPLESDRLVVVAAGEIDGYVPELAQRLHPWMRRGWESLRLVASRSAAPFTASPARDLAELLDVEVLAPDGNLVAVPGGSLFVSGGHRDGDRPGSWWRFRPGQPPSSAGARFPEPYWEHDLAGLTDPDVPGLVIEHIPAGLWVRRPGSVHRKDLAYAIPVEPRSIALVVSRPGDEPLPALDFIRLASTLPSSIRDQLVAVPYGDDPVEGFPLGAVMAAATERNVRVLNGLPLQVDRYRRRVFTIDRHARPSWAPLVHEFVWRPGVRAGMPSSWSTPDGDLVPIGSGQLVLSRHWLVELVAAGMWIRPIDVRVSDRARKIPVHAEHCTVVLSGPPRGRGPRPPWRRISRLLRSLPDASRGKLQLAVTSEAGERTAYEAARACARELGNRPVQVLDADGVMVPRYAALPLNRLFAFLGMRPTVVRLGDRARARFTSHRATRTAGVDRPARGSGELDGVRSLGFVDRIRRSSAREPGTAEPRHRQYGAGRVPGPQSRMPEPQQPPHDDRASAPPATPPIVATPQRTGHGAWSATTPAAARTEPYADRPVDRTPAPQPRPAPPDPPPARVDTMQVVNRTGRHRAGDEMEREPSAIQPRAAGWPAHRAQHRAPTGGPDDRD